MRFLTIVLAATSLAFSSYAFALNGNAIFNASSCDQVLDNNGYFKTCYDYGLKGAKRGWAVLDGSLVHKKNIKKRPRFYADKKLPAKYRTHYKDYTHTKRDRGHFIVSDADLDYSKASQESTYAMSQIQMQRRTTNRRSYLATEKYGRQVASKLGKVNAISLAFYKPTPKRINGVAEAYGFAKVFWNNDRGFERCFYIPNDNKSYKLKQMQMDCTKLLRNYRLKGNP